MNQHEDRIRDALERLVTERVVAPAQVEPITQAVRDALAAPIPQRGARWTEIISYAGGALVLAGAMAMLGPAWQDLSRGVRFGLLGLITVLLLGVALVVQRTGSAARRRVAGVLWTLGAGTAALGAAQLAHENEALIGSVVGLVVAVAGYVRFPGSVGLLAIGVLSMTATIMLLDLIDLRSRLLEAFAVIALGTVFAALAAAGVLRHRALGLGIGSVLALIGAQWPVLLTDHGAWPYLLTLVIAVGCLALYMWENTWVLIVAGVAGIAIAVPEAIWNLTNGALGGGIMTVLTGFILLGAGVLGLIWHRNVG
ncbi:DUF2157 domain-containing protein [Actinomadura alba]|uniref:DUF2157 domain-containing protein n=1 Tax=Actinomadura alba TaxID=406431 RepID=A0ABR7LSB5_9ACTN|nr:DUF2157 domain-containing protein [Actinomadura alba]MBC6467323.1 hypothetical protein [Actinomadura alba]